MVHEVASHALERHGAAVRVVRGAEDVCGEASPELRVLRGRRKMSTRM